MTPSSQRVFITGASSGIGKALAIRYAKDGYQLTLLGRDTQKLLELQQHLHTTYQISATTLSLDLATETGRKDAVQALQATSHDILVNNAGFGQYGLFEDIPLAKQREMIEVNILALTELTHAAIPLMKQRGGGKILNVASVAAFMPGPLMAVYYATKAYVLSFSEALANELKNAHIQVSVLCPGPTATGFSHAAGLSSSKLFRDNVMTVEEVVEIGYQQFQAGSTTIIPGFTNKLFPFLVRFSPRALVPKIVRYVQEKK